VDTPALLPDGTAAEASVSRVLAARGTVRSAPALAEDVEHLNRQVGDAPHAGRDAAGPATTEEETRA
jgi:NADH-quinone oxidoreductase subunit J